MIGVLDLLDPGERALIRRNPNVLPISPPSKDCGPLGLGDASPNDRAGEGLVKRLEDIQAVLEVLEDSNRLNTSASTSS